MGKNQDPGSGINISDPQHCNFGLPGSRSADPFESGSEILLIRESGTGS
jgi:hypothetical protein